MNKTITIAALAFLVAAGSATAQDQSEAQIESEALETLESEPDLTPEEQAEIERMAEMQCRTSPVTGSRTRVNRTCMTRGEWRALQRGTRHDVDRMQGGAAGANFCRPEDGKPCYS